MHFHLGHCSPCYSTEKKKETDAGLLWLCVSFSSFSLDCKQTSPFTIIVPAPGEWSLPKHLRSSILVNKTWTESEKMKVKPGFSSRKLGATKMTVGRLKWGPQRGAFCETQRWWWDIPVWFPSGCVQAVFTVNGPWWPPCSEECLRNPQLCGTCILIPKTSRLIRWRDRFPGGPRLTRMDGEGRAKPIARTTVWAWRQENK